MATEIELKAPVQDSEAFRRLLCEKAEYLGAFEKEDTYWPGVPGLPGSGLRVRREKRTLPGGIQKEAVFAAYKTKEVKDGIEINDEREFEVNPGPVFEEFLKKMELKPGFSKRKRGWAFSKEGICAELVEVDGNSNGFRSLGWFIELEILANNKQEKTLAEARTRLLDFLAELGIKKETIESRFYSEMLKSTTSP